MLKYTIFYCLIMQKNRYFIATFVIDNSKNGQKEDRR